MKRGIKMINQSATLRITVTIPVSDTLMAFIIFGKGIPVSNGVAVTISIIQVLFISDENVMVVVSVWLGMTSVIYFLTFIIIWRRYARCMFYNKLYIVNIVNYLQLYSGFAFCCPINVFPLAGPYTFCGRYIITSSGFGNYSWF